MNDADPRTAQRRPCGQIVAAAAHPGKIFAARGGVPVTARDQPLQVLLVLPVYQRQHQTVTAIAPAAAAASIGGSRQLCTGRCHLIAGNFPLGAAAEMQQ